MSVLKEIIKRDGLIDVYDKNKIVSAIYAAAKSVGGSDCTIAQSLADIVEQALIDSDIEKPTVDNIQDVVERILIKEGHAKTAKAYILFRDKRDRARDSNSQLMTTIRDLTLEDSSTMDLKRENANIDGNSTMGTMLRYGSEASKRFVHLNLLRPEHSKAHLSGLIHVHDLDFYPLTINCLTRDTEITIIDHTGQEQSIAVSFFDSLFVTRSKSAVNLEMFNFKIKSENGQFTKIINVMRRPIGIKELVYEIATEGHTDKPLTVTANHTIPVLRGDNNKPILIKARNIVIDDKLTVFDSTDSPDYTLLKVVDIKVINDYQGYVYDIETENHLFVANNYLVHNCIQIDIAKLFKGGFSTGHGKLREPSNIRSAASLAAIAIQSDQNDCFGGQSIAKFDYDLAKYVAYTYVDEFVRTLDYDGVLDEKEAKLFKKQCKKYVDEHDGHIINDDGIAYMNKALSSTKAALKFLEKDALKERHKLAYKYTNKDSYQAMEAFVHNMNTLHCIPGSERIWVFDTETAQFCLMSVEDLYDSFMMNKFKAISFDEKTGTVELQYIEGIEKKDNYRDLVRMTVIGSNLNITVTTNHKMPSFVNDKFQDITADLVERVTVLQKSHVFSNTVVCDGDAIVINGSPTELTSSPVQKEFFNSGKEYVYDICVAKNHNFLTEHNVFVKNSRAGAQVPFSSVNYGTDTSEEGRIIIKNLLYALEAGLGDGETPIFPIHVFKVKDGINGEKGDPNYDLLQLACKVSGERLFPNFVFLDAPFNLQYYKENQPETEATTMGCILGKSQVIVRDLAYKYNPVENFKQSRSVTINELFELCEAPIETSGASEYKDVEKLEYPSNRPKIYDSASGQFVKIKKIIKNPDQSNWVEITVAGREEPIFVTANHYLQVSRNGGAVINRVAVKDLTLTDALIDTDGRHLPITKLSFVGYMNEFGYDVETESDRFDFDGIRSHNCRTRVVGNVYDPSREIFTSRGNLSFTTINLPRLAILSDHNVDVFFDKLKDTVDMVFDQLLDRFEVQASKKVKNLPFIMGQGVYLDSDQYGSEDTVREIIKHGTMTVGFIGLAECLVALIGKHHGESAEAQELGLKIIGFMRELCDKKSQETRMNFSLIGAPAEGLSGRFVQLDKKQFGIIPGVTDKDWYTNSNHVPVEFPIGISKKIDIEAPYHALENGGHISYVEVDGDIASNPEAFEQIIQYMKKAGIGYGSINHDGGDFDPVCGYHGKIGETCPRCGRRSGEPIDENELAKKLANFQYTVDDEIALS